MNELSNSFALCYKKEEQYVGIIKGVTAFNVVEKYILVKRYSIEKEQAVKTSLMEEYFIIPIQTDPDIPEIEKSFGPYYKEEFDSIRLSFGIISELKFENI